MSSNSNSSISCSESCTLNVANLGGIDEANITFQPGISLLTGENATNRSSYLHSVAAVLGADEMAANLKTDADHGNVHLEVNGETYTREYERKNGVVRKEGNPYSDKPGIVDTFVSLFADNPARKAINDGGDLREVFMGPVDTEEIRREISELKEEKTSLENRISDIRKRERRLPKLEEERQRIKGELEEVETDIEELRQEIDEAEDIKNEVSEESSELRDELTTLRSNLGDVEGEIDKTEQQIEYRQSELQELEEEREEIKSELDELDPLEDIERVKGDLDDDIDRLMDQKRKMEAAVEDLQSIIRLNENILDGEFDVVASEAQENIASALDPESEAVECWTCGTEVERGQITNRLETLRNILKDHRSELTDIDNRIGELQTKKRKYEKQQTQHKNLQERLGEVSEQTQLHERRIEELESDRDELLAEVDNLEEQIEDVETRIEQLETEETQEEEYDISKAHQQLSKLERKRGRLESRVEEKTDTIEEIEELSEEREKYEENLSSVKDELAELRGKIDRLEEEIVDTLNTMMEDIIDILQYRNIARVWIERKTTENKESNSEFDLHIVREADDGTVYEDTADTLSESEREVLGLVIAITGYLVHDVCEEVPFILLDSVEMVDGERLAKLLNYIDEKADVSFLLVVLLPKDAQAVNDTELLPESNTLHSESLGLPSDIEEES